MATSTSGCDTTYCAETSDIHAEHADHCAENAGDSAEHTDVCVEESDCSPKVSGDSANLTDRSA